MGGLTFLIFYLSPTLIAWYRAQQGKSIVLPLGKLFFFNLVLGWTVVGWVLALANAFGFNPIAPVARAMAKGMAPGGVAAMNPGPMTSESGNLLGRTCPTCGGQGRMTCTGCNGSGQRYEGAGLTTCSLCLGQRTVQCTCGGSGRVYS